MMKFASPNLLSLLWFILPLVLFIIWAWRKKQDSMRLFADRKLIARLTEKVSWQRQKAKEVLIIISVALLIFALSRPQIGFKWEDVKRRGVDIMIVVDVSRSMLARDVSPSRMEHAKRKIEDLLNIVKGDRIGLIAFAGKAFVLTPLTLDYGAIRLFADALEPDLVPVPGTALGEALELATKALNKAKPESKAIILLTDGEDLAGNMEKDIKKAKESGTRIYALGIGTKDGAPIPLPEGGFLKNNKNEMVLTKLDMPVLESMAEETKGIALTSVAGDSDLEAIYNNIRGDLKETELKGNREKRYIDRFQWILFAALILLLIETLLNTKKASGKILLLIISFIILNTLFIPQASAFTFGTTGKIQDGEKLYNEGNYDKALEKFLSAQVDKPNDLRLKYNIANTYYNLGKYQEAEKVFDSIIKDNKKELNEKSTYNQGNSLYKQGMLEDSLKAYENALKLDPKDEDAKFNYEFVKRKLEEQKNKQENKDNNKQENQKDKNKEENQSQKDQSKEQQKNNQDQKSDDNKEKNSDEQKQNQEDQNQQKQNEQNKQEENQQNKEQDQKNPAQAGAEAQEKMKQDEAKRWLSTVSEGKRKNYPVGAQSSGKHENKGEW